MTATLSQEVGLAVEHAPAEDAPVDGRTLRAQRTRDAVVEALLALQEEGDLNPTAQRVAARAGVALRTVYGHFSDMESLYLEAGRRELVKIQLLADVPPADLPLDERIARTAASRARTSEALLPVLRAARLRLPYSEALQRNWRLFIDIGDDTVRTVFSRELAAAGEDAEDLVHALYLVVSATAWDTLRHDRGLEPEDAERVVLKGVRVLLAPYADSPRA